MTYFNTTHVVGKPLGEYEKKAANQEEKILRYFLTRPRMLATPSMIWEELFKQSASMRATVPITSVRRALTNLTNEGDLIKTGHQKKGAFGRPEYFWKIAPHHLQGDLFK